MTVRELFTEAAEWAARRFEALSRDTDCIDAKQEACDWEWLRYLAHEREARAALATRLDQIDRDWTCIGHIDGEPVYRRRARQEAA